MTDAITNAMAAAKAEAEKFPETTGTAVAASPTPSVPAAGGAPRSLTDFMDSASMNVEAYLSVSELGLRFGKDIKIHDEIFVEMCFKDAKAGYVLRFNGTGGVQYLTSWDGVSEVRSKQNWAAVIADAKKMDGNSYPSDLVELPVKLLQSYDRKEGGPLKEGTVVGLSLSYQNSKAFSAFLKDNYPRYKLTESFMVKITAVPKKGSGQDYGVFGYTVVDELPGKAKKAA